MTTAHQGTRDCSIAEITRTDPRTLPIFSPSMPTTVPGWSTRFTIGRWKVSHMSMNVSIFSAAGRLSPPPLWYGSLIITPTA
jgi:hypothetical protein